MTPTVVRTRGRFLWNIRESVWERVEVELEEKEEEEEW